MYAAPSVVSNVRPRPYVMACLTMQAAKRGSAAMIVPIAAAPVTGVSVVPITRLPEEPTAAPLSVVRYAPVASKFSNGKPAGSMVWWQLEQPGIDACTSSVCRTVMPGMIAGNGGTTLFGGG